MQYSGLQVFSFVVLLVGTAAIVGSIATDYWSVHSTGGSGELGVGELSIDMSIKQHRGLWQACTEFGGKAQVCNNRFEEIEAAIKEKDTSEVKMQAWEIGVLVLMVGSAFLGIVSLIVSPCCCNRCGCCLTVLVLLATLCCAAGVGLYAYYTKTGKAMTVSLAGSWDATVKNPLADNSDFGWSYWLAVGGGACQLVATLCFGVARGRQHSYSQTF